MSADSRETDTTGRVILWAFRQRKLEVDPSRIDPPVAVFVRAVFSRFSNANCPSITIVWRLCQHSNVLMASEDRETPSHNIRHICANDQQVWSGSNDFEIFTLINTSSARAGGSLPRASWLPSLSRRRVSQHSALHRAVL